VHAATSSMKIVSAFIIASLAVCEERSSAARTRTPGVIIATAELGSLIGYASSLGSSESRSVNMRL
jgi:hypothetical protein